MYNDSSLTDNIISRHFNQSLNSELFSLNYQLNNEQNANDQLSQIDQLNQKNEINQMNQVNDKEIIQNKKDKIRDLIKDCELINNNNINNFVASYLDQSASAGKVSQDKCSCKCNCHKKHKNPFHLIRSNKFISTLSRIKSHPKSTDKKTENCSINSSNLNNLDQDYNTFASSLSNYSLSSSSSISSQTVSVSSCSSSVQDNNYNQLNTNVVLTRPTRKPPMPPPAVTLTTTRKFNKPPAKLPSSVQRDDFEKANIGRCKEENYLNNEMCKEKSKDEFGYNYNDMRILTKSFEDLLNIKTDLSEIQESIYETIDSDYEENENDKVVDKEKDNEEDLYEDVENLKDDEDDIYESLTNNYIHGSLDLLSGIKDLPMKQDNYVNCQNLDERKLMKQQRVLEKKLQSKAEKLKKKFNVSGNEIPLNAGVVKADYKGTHNNLTVNKDEIVLIMRITGNPAGKWLAKNERGKFGYIDLNLVDVDTNTLKCLYNEPNVLMS